MHYLVILFLLIIPANTCFAKNETLVIASSEGPPHMVRGSFHGIDLDIIQAILFKLGYSVKFEFPGLARGKHLVISHKYDAIAPIFWQQDEKGFYTSDPIVQYKPMVFSLKRNKLNPTSLRDLKGASIATFQGAPGYFGPEFTLLANTPKYQEMVDMSVLSDLLVKDRFDYVVLDKYIFYYYFRLKNHNRDTSIFTEHNLIPQVPASIGFHDKNLRENFNKELSFFYHSKAYFKIIERYIGMGLIE
ncbi:transporter substrate-binding domain-containing protein [Pseudoalteromonas sp. C2R02]|uniref:substrate-binding periplasmic protein n=1 Tax=Pseudoalteromonas sp. C2R02 TaxID=2841565 RepID=UPI001C0A1F86|nr:transporter substrate-binding domain-containing protein [Pseudoalteromonas sp. C2R02]MBU2970451.1 transporter substrate-binding domain-containing protein [Pseudoalteromonas sp. C2R02]